MLNLSVNMIDLFFFLSRHPVSSELGPLTMFQAIAFCAMSLGEGAWSQAGRLILTSVVVAVEVRSAYWTGGRFRPLRLASTAISLSRRLRFFLPRVCLFAR